MTNRNRIQIPANRKFKAVWPVLLVVSGLAFQAQIFSIPARAQDAQSAPGAGSAASSQRTDGQIEMDVVHALDANAALQPDWITAGTVQGEVTLSGTSGSEANRQLAESIAAKVPGVTKVDNNLKVGDPQVAAQAANDPSQPEPAPEAQQPPYPNQQQAASDNAPQPPAYPTNPPAYPPSYQQSAPPRTGYQAIVPQQPVPPLPTSPVTVPQGGLLKVRTSEPLFSKSAKDGTPIEFTLTRDVYAGGFVAMPRGATLRGHVVDVRKSGAVSGSPELALRVETLELGGKTYALDTAPYDVKGPNKAGRTAGSAFGGALFGALIGGAIGGGEGAAIGAGAGAVGGTAASAATPGPGVWIPAEAVIDIHLNTPVTVDPVSAQEVQRLAANAPLPNERPTLYRRGPYPYYPPPPPPPGYYYRPYPY